MKDSAYLRELKKYARQMFGDNDNAQEILADLHAESDRGAFILAATSVEDTLEWVLGARMSVLETDETARKEVFGAQGTISTYADKILIAYALGIIDREGRKQIDLVREIRNACAHSRRRLTMDTPTLVDAVKAAIGDDVLNAIKDHEPRTLRLAFISHCAALGAYIATGKRRSPLEVYADEVLSGRHQPKT